MIKFAIPLLHVSDSSLARAFYCDKLGFRHEFSHRADDTKPDPCYMGLTRDGVWLNLSSFSGDGVSGGVVNLIVDDVDVRREVVGHFNGGEASRRMTEGETLQGDIALASNLERIRGR